MPWSVLTLSVMRWLFQEKCHQYWPSERSARYQYFVVDPMAEYNMPQYILREFKVTDARVSPPNGHSHRTFPEFSRNEKHNRTLFLNLE